MATTAIEHAPDTVLSDFFRSDIGNLWLNHLTHFLSERHGFDNFGCACTKQIELRCYDGDRASHLTRVSRRVRGRVSQGINTGFGSNGTANNHVDSTVSIICCRSTRVIECLLGRDFN